MSTASRAVSISTSVRRSISESPTSTISTKVAAIYKVDGEHAFARSEFILAPGLVRDVPATWYGAIHVTPASIPQLERTLFSAYPTITVINLADILQTIQDVAGHIILVIRFLAGFSILSGAIILASSVASTRFRRIREVVVLKTLGATRNRIAQVFSIEFLVLGLLSGAVGVLFANLLARILLQRMDIHWHADYFASGLHRLRNRHPCHRHRLDRQLPHPRPEAARSSPRRMRLDDVCALFKTIVQARIVSVARRILE